MPNFDGTGPNGSGPQTGRRMGKCTGANSTSNQNNRGLGRQCRRNRINSDTSEN